MANITQKSITDYEDHLPKQYDESLALRKILTVFLDQVQDLEVANNQLAEFSTDIEKAYGSQLDIIGNLVGEERQGKPDDQYREAIYFRISVNIGNGTPEDCLQYLAYVTKSSQCQIWEHYPASIVMETNGAILPSNIAKAIDNISLAGVSVGGIISVPENGQVFRGTPVTSAENNKVGSIYTAVDDSDQLARSMFPDVNVVTTRGICPDIYTT
jgi:hypothetical protein